jgi:hypothetical protein
VKPTPSNDPVPAEPPDHSAVRPIHSRKNWVAILLLIPLAGLAAWAVSRETGHPGKPGAKLAAAGSGQAEDDTVSLTFKALEFDPGPEWAGKHVTAKDPVKLPPSILALDGKRVRITGFLVPVLNVGGYVREFFITSSPTSCCFGTAPRIFDFILAKMPVGPDTSYVGEPTVFEGVLHVQKPPAGDEWTPIFTMDCTDVYR